MTIYSALGLKRAQPYFAAGRPTNAQQICADLRQLLRTHGVDSNAISRVGCVPNTLSKANEYLLQIDCEPQVGEQVKQVLRTQNTSNTEGQPISEYTFAGLPVRIQYKIITFTREGGGSSHIL